MQKYVRDTITKLIDSPLSSRYSHYRVTWGKSFFMSIHLPIYLPPPFGTHGERKQTNVLPHILRNKEYDLEWLKWCRNQSYLQKNTLRDIDNRIKEIEAL